MDYKGHWKLVSHGQTLHSTLIVRQDGRHYHRSRYAPVQSTGLEGDLGHARQDLSFPIIYGFAQGKIDFTVVEMVALMLWAFS